MPSHASSSGNRAKANTGKRSQNHINEDPTSSSAQAQTFLTALRNVIIPLVQTALPNQRDLDQVPFGPEAEEFLVAFQKYITSIIRDQSPSDSEAGVKRAVDDEDATTTPDQASTLSGLWRCPVDTTVEVSFKSIASSESLPSSEKGVTAVVPSIGPAINLQQPGILTKTLSILRQHVFDTMPIRLLRFGTRRAKFEITLVEREQIYAELASQIQAEFDKNAEPGNINDMVLRTARYSILSHTWLRGTPGEVTYDNWLKRDFDTEQPGYQKLVNFCKAAADHGFIFGWMDTVCINKASSTELDESIRSMYKWYGKANNCIVYLAGTTDVSAMDTDPWFTRGWTLQELVAPRYLKFYDTNWNKLVDDSSNDKTNPIILQNIESASMISQRDMAALSAVSISRRMQWAARREVTRGEDGAYSLMGIFDVNISIAYGEGAEQAFLRLIKEILNTTNNVIDIFNWGGEYSFKNLPLLPSSPKAYLHSYPTERLPMDRPIEPLTLTHLGLRIPVVILWAVSTKITAPLKGPPYYHYPQRLFHAIINIEPFLPDIPHSYVPSATLLLPEIKYDHYDTMAFAILNASETDEKIAIPKTCLAVAITGDITPLGYKQKIATKKPIVFDLVKEIGNSEAETPLHYIIRRSRSEVDSYGMQRINIIL